MLFLIDTDDGLKPETVKAVIHAFRNTHIEVEYVAAPRRQTADITLGGDIVAEITIAGNTLAVYRIAPSPQDTLQKSLKRIIRPIDDQELEGQGHLEGRARWFNRSHEDKDKD